jgi:hypothetical protein
VRIPPSLPSGVLAQEGEHSYRTAEVAGSSPARSTRCRSGEDGRRATFRASWAQAHVGSTPTFGTMPMRVWRNWQTRSVESAVDFDPLSVQLRSLAPMPL